MGEACDPGVVTLLTAVGPGVVVAVLAVGVDMAHNQGKKRRKKVASFIYIIASEKVISC